MSQSDEQWQFLKDVAKLIIYADDIGVKLTAGEMWRPDEMQELYLISGKSQVYESQHQKRLAVDFNLFVGGKIQWVMGEEFKLLGEFWKSLSPKNKWGGDYKTFFDGYHFQRDS